jgi:hypothetical protein
MGRHPAGPRTRRRGHRQVEGGGEEGSAGKTVEARAHRQIAEGLDLTPAERAELSGLKI